MAYLLPTREQANMVSLLAALLLAAGCGRAPLPSTAESVPAAAASEPEPGEGASTAVASPAPTPPQGAHANTSAGRPTNRLSRETSPYLLLHAHNPVDWYPWGEEALAKARQENKLIFLSIGYSSCHWCHVMEREAFSDAEVAAYLNQHFVCIKVDREERPDIDNVYMTALHMFNQLARTGRGGGWPLSMFLTPEAEPFFGGTYFPARDEDRPGHIGFLTLIRKVQETWLEGADKVRDDAHVVARVTKEELERRPVLALAEPGPELLGELQEALSERYDATYGGFGFSPETPQRPKFPEPSQLLFLLTRAQQGNAAAQGMLTGTLDHLARGGIRDHLGGGFHRYSVDRFWRIPHFEKMLYDNGQLVTVFAGAYTLGQQAEYRQVVVETCEFVLREMTSPEGAFYSALDADSEHEEGKFYRWEKSELESLLVGENGRLFARVYSLEGEPNFEEKFFVPQWPDRLAALAEKEKLSAAEIETRVAPLRAQLLAKRGQRVRPLTDTKILTSWNGYMIRGLADAGQALGEPRYTAAAARAANFILQHMRGPEHSLLRTYAQGKAKTAGYVDDYANLVDGLIALHRATGEPQWLSAANELTTLQIKLFADEKRGGFFNSSAQHETLLARAQDASDGVEPCGNSVTAGNLLYLATALKQPEHRELAGATIRSTLGLARGSLLAVPRLAVAFNNYLPAATPAPGK